MAELPPAIRDYLAGPSAAGFTPDAVVTDDGRTYRGRDEIDGWLRRAATEYQYTATLMGVSPAAGEWTVTQHLTGEFPGGEVDLSYRFRLRGERIAVLTIAP
ncbi:nuclear transport factor 2 family protein [Amycolatopsis methanolica]|uniref:nuclear transport factor 2 family protein n=1 Tax=Amycolatopsis methanolica TaxID=1814 RepID=UPI000374BF9C|nr:nuclear transport factor 2 family protein [Amycolatopsis methanolica]